MYQAVKLGYLRSNSCENTTLPRIIPYEMNPLTKSEMIAFLDVLKGNEYEVLCTVTMFTGFRIGEITGLTWNRVNFKSGTILIDW